MTRKSRQQLTLFVNRRDSAEIEYTRKHFNPLQHQLIMSHVTLCREEELADLDTVLKNLQQLNTSPISIQFGEVIRFDNDKGVMLPAQGDNGTFHQLRSTILTGISGKQSEPHITLMHPRNSTCTDEAFHEIQKVSFPKVLSFDTISLIEQVDGGQWSILKNFHLNKTQH